MAQIKVLVAIPQPLRGLVLTEETLADLRSFSDVDLNEDGHNWDAAELAARLPGVASPVRFATDAEIRDAIGAGPGSLGPVGLPIPCIADRSVAVMADFAAGANQDDKHWFGINWGRDVDLPPLVKLDVEQIKRVFVNIMDNALQVMGNEGEIEIVTRYNAESRFITIVPEIEMPAHVSSALASYPELACADGPFTVPPGGIWPITSIYCAGKESTFRFIEDVLLEVMDLFPGEFIHVGGDEADKQEWKKCPRCQARMRREGLKDEAELQSYFIKRMEKIIESKGKKLIGWDEILEGGLAPNAAVMSWRGMQGGITAAKAQHHVVMSPVDYAYLDFYQGDPAIEPPTYAMLRLKKVYEFEPVPEGVDPEYILGGQGNLWTESVPTFRHAEYMLWPRAFALAEVLWTPANERQWSDFEKRIEYNLKQLDQSDINYARSFFDAIIIPSRDDNGNLLITLDSEVEGISFYYTFDNTLPDDHSPSYIIGEKLTIPKDADTFRVITYRDGKPLGRIITVPLSDLERRIPAK